MKFVNVLLRGVDGLGSMTTMQLTSRSKECRRDGKTEWEAEILRIDDDDPDSFSCTEPRFEKWRGNFMKVLHDGVVSRISNDEEVPFEVVVFDVEKA